MNYFVILVKLIITSQDFFMNVKKAILTTGSLVGLALLSEAAFSWRTKVEIKNRAGHRSELTGCADRPLECMHLNHSRGVDEEHVHYDDAQRGMLVSDIEHLAYHIFWQDTPEQIGLLPHQNEWAINAITQRVIDWNNSHTDQVTYNSNVRLNESLQAWHEFYEQRA